MVTNKSVSKSKIYQTNSLQEKEPKRSLKEPMVTNPYPSQKFTKQLITRKGTQKEPKGTYGHKSLSKSKNYTKELRNHREPKRNPMVSGEKPSGTQKEPKGTYGHKSLSKSKIYTKELRSHREPKRNPMVSGQKPSGTQKEPNAQTQENQTHLRAPRCSEGLIMMKMTSGHLER